MKQKINTQTTFRAYATDRYATNFKIAVLLMFIIVFVIAGCTRPDQASPNENYCSAGASVLTVNDDNISAAVKNTIYARPAGYVGVGHPDYNPNIPLVIIPYMLNDAFTFNTTVSADVIRTNFFSTGTGSIKDYFYENSWGQFNIHEGFIANGVMLSQTGETYGAGQPGNDWTRNPAVAQEICQLSNVNWNALDVNHNHIIEPREAVICFMRADGGGGATRPSGITISTNTGNITINNRFVYFSCKSNDDPTKGSNDISYNYSTMWHELCHGMFGLPDRYTDYCGSGKTGAYDLMSDNCSRKNMSIYDKMKLGWIRPRILRLGEPGRCYSFPASESTPAALILVPNYPSPFDGSEYWIIENRYKNASSRDFDSNLPASGLAIWYVKETTNSLSFVDARNPSQWANNINYSASEDQTGAIFKYNPANPVNVYSLSTENGRGIRLVSAISPEGAVMYINL
jgi:M6 family metalloprotease-like protein